MDGLPIKQDVYSASAVFAGDLDICLAGCHGNGSPLLPDGHCIPVVAGKNVAAGTAN